MTGEVTLEPLRHLPLLKDLVIDRNYVYRKMLTCVPHMQTEGNGTAHGLRAVPMEVIDTVVRLDECIHCLCCMAVCPAYKKDPELFPGPIGLLTLATIRNQMGGVNAEKAALCLECGLCEKACPRHIPIFTEAIARLKGR
jgi:succinate dehydrogenase/fumarate reductase-like Fe-S protein